MANLMVLNADVGVVGDEMAAAAPGVNRLATSAYRQQCGRSSGLRVNAEFKRADHPSAPAVPSATCRSP